MLPIRVVIAEDHELVRKSFISLLGRFKEIQVVGEAGNGRELIDIIKTKVPHVVLCDIEMPLWDGLRALEVIGNRFPTVKVIMLSMHFDQSIVYHTIMAGARGFLQKNCKVDELIHTIKTVHEKGQCFSEDVTQAVMNGARNQAKVNPLLSEKGLSDREMDVLKLVCTGLTNKEVAQRLNITARTVDFHKSNLYSKTRSTNVAELIRFSVTNGLVDLGTAVQNRY